jgi:fucose permease
MTEQQLLSATALGAGLIAGLVLRLSSNLGSLLGGPLGIAEGRARLISAVFLLLLVPMMLVGGLLVDQWGSRPVLIVALLLVGAGIAVLEVSRSYRRALPDFLALGIAEAGVCTAAVVLLPAAFFPRQETASANLGMIAFTGGYLLAPGLIRLLQRRFGFRGSLQILAMICLLPVVPAILTNTSAFPHPAPGNANVLTDPLLGLAALLAFLYPPLEGSVRIWAPAYLGELFHPKPPPTFLWAAFWGVFLGARLLAIFVPLKFAPWLLLGLALLAAITLGNVIGASRPASGGLGLLLVGFAFGPILPTVIGLSLHQFPVQQGTALGVVLGSAALGSLIWPPLIEYFAPRLTARHVMLIPLGFALALTLTALVFGLVL